MVALLSAGTPLVRNCSPYPVCSIGGTSARLGTGCEREGRRSAECVVAQFVYGTRVNVPDYVVTSGGTYRLVTDHLGSPRLVIN
jgi:hypothetical protein